MTFNLADYDRLSRRCADAATRFKRAAAWLIQLHHDEPSPHALVLVGMEAETLLANALDDAELLVAVCRDGADWEELQRAADQLRSAVRARRLALVLAEGEGRTPEERAIFEAAAARIREGGS